MLVNAGGALVYTGSYLYAFRGGGRKPSGVIISSGGTWSAMKLAPGNVNGGGALTWDGGNYIYALQGAYVNLLEIQYFRQ